MCGRTACTLQPEVICRACTYYDVNSSTYKQPQWKEHPNSGSSDHSKSAPTDRASRNGNVEKQNGDSKEEAKPSPYRYYPSANQTPTKCTPVLYKDSTGATVLQPMMWGLIPSWHKGEPKSHGLSTNNCRLEGVRTSKLFNRPLNQRKRCVIIAQGFYEWNSVDAKPKTPKQPYLIYLTQDDPKLKIHDEALWNNAEWSEEKGWQGPKILMMAGLYDVWNSPSGEVVYSYSIFTMASNKTLSWLHDRMPAILETPEQAQAWLDSSPETSTTDLLSILKPSTQLQWYTVSKKVNSSRCWDMDCMNPIDLKEVKSNSFMSNWLKRAEPQKTKAESDAASEEDMPLLKKSKSDLQLTQIRPSSIGAEKTAEKHFMKSTTNSKSLSASHSKN